MHLGSVVFCLILVGCSTWHIQQVSSLSLRTRSGDALPRNNNVPLKIGAFNIQVFGEKKMSIQAVKRILVKLILRYDILLVQEIRSTTDNAINGLLAAVNRVSEPKNIYSMELSARLGRTTSKEQYAFLYRRDKVQVVESYVYSDIDKDVFQREPFIAMFRTKNAYLSKFVLVGIHTQPSAAPSEIDHLVDVYDDIVKRLNVRDVMLMGDFNAGCSYVTNSEWKRIRLATDHRFYWLFTNSDDTTVSKSDCPYDRMVIAGEKMKKAIVPKSEKVYNFAQALDLNMKEAKLVSDHWIIEAQLKDKSYEEEERFYRSQITLTVIDTNAKPVSKNAIYLLRRIQNPLLATFTSSSIYTKRGSSSQISLTKLTDSTRGAHKAVEQLRKYFPKLVSANQVVIAARKLSAFVDKLTKSCVLQENRSNQFNYQVIGDGSCSQIINIHSVTLLCSVSDRRCKLEFLFK